MNKVYRVVSDEAYNELGRAEYGYLLIPNSIIAFKIIEQDLDSEPVKSILQKFYENPVWQEKIYKKNKKHLYESIGLKYSKGKPVMTKKFTTMLKSWRIEIDPDDEQLPYALSFRCLDYHDQTTYYGKNILDKYCPDEIKLLLERGIIEEVDVDDEGRYLVCQ